MGALQISLEDASTRTIGAPFRAPRRSCTLTRSVWQIRKSQAPDEKAASTLVGKDWDLVQLAIAGNADAQERLFKTYTPKLYRTVFTLLGNREDAEDAVQESWCKAYANLDSFEGRAAFSTGLTRIAINSALMLRRRKSTRVEACLNDVLDNHSEPFFDGTESPNPEEIYPQVVYLQKCARQMDQRTRCRPVLPPESLATAPQRLVSIRIRTPASPWRAYYT